MTIVSSIFGLITVLGIIREIYKSDMSGHKIGGALCILLLGMNNFIYYTENYIEISPLLQKDYICGCINLDCSSKFYISQY